MYRFITIGIIGLFGLSAHAATQAKNWGVNVEPYLGYQGIHGGVNEKKINAQYTTDNGGYHGFILGGRTLVEYKQLIFAGLDFSYAPSMGYTSHEGQSPVNNSTSELRLGPVIGFNFGTLFPKVPLRVWVGYNFIDTIKDRNNAANTVASGNSTLTMSGHSFKLGAGYQLIRYLSLNLEYVVSSFSTLQSDTLSPGKTKTYKLPSTDYFGLESLSQQTVIISVSAPFSVY